MYTHFIGLCSYNFMVMYSMVMEYLLKRVLAKREGFGDSWHAAREELLLIYTEALSSNCSQLVQMIQVFF